MSPFLVPITAFIMIGLVVLARSPIGLALADRLRGHAAAAGELQQQLDEMHGTLEAIRAELAETQERVDFAERLLSQKPDAAKLEG